MRKMKDKNKDSELMSATEVADLIGVSTRMLRKLRAERRAGKRNAAPPELKPPHPPATFERKAVVKWAERTGHIARFSTRELAPHLGVSHRTLRRMVTEGADLPKTMTRAGKTYFLAKDVVKWARGRNSELMHWAQTLMST